MTEGRVFYRFYRVVRAEACPISDSAYQVDIKLHDFPVLVFCSNASIISITTP